MTDKHGMEGKQAARRAIVSSAIVSSAIVSSAMEQADRQSRPL